MIEYYQVWLSAETQEDAKEILHALVNAKLIVGGTILSGPSCFWWKGEEVDMDYFYIMGFSTTEHRAAIEKSYAQVSKEEVPMASFIKIEGNGKFLQYIFETVAGN